jgi:HEPN domain-containing protein
VDFPYTHNIARLVELCAAAAAWTEVLSEAEELTPYAVTARHPGHDEVVTQEEAVRAIEIAARVRQVIKAALAREGISPPPDPSGSG